MTRPRKALGAPPGLVLVFFIPWLLLAAVLAWHSGAWIEQKDWARASGKVTGVTVKPVTFTVVEKCSKTNRNQHEVVVEYEFEVNGERYQGNRYDYENQGEFFCQVEPANDRAKAIESKKTVTVYYDPKNPSKSVLAPADASYVYVGAPVLGVAGLLLVAFFFRQRKRYRDAERAELESA